MKLTTLHRTIKPELMEQPNTLVTVRGRRSRRRRHHTGQPVHDRNLPAGTRRVAGAASSSRRTPATGMSRWRTSGTSASSHAAGTARSPTRASRPTTTAWCVSLSAPGTSGTVTGWTPAAGTAASSCSAGWTTPTRPTCRSRCAPGRRRGERGRPVRPGRAWSRRRANGRAATTSVPTSIPMRPGATDWAASARVSSARPGSTTSAWRLPRSMSCGR